MIRSLEALYNQSFTIMSSRKLWIPPPWRHYPWAKAKLRDISAQIGHGYDMEHAGPLANVLAGPKKVTAWSRKSEASIEDAAPFL